MDSNPTDAVPKGLYRHISDIDVWVAPDRNYLVFIILSFVGGLLALDHFYLRSYDTAFYKILLNIFGLGIWWFWDIIQILTESKKIRLTGLASPFDWIFGIGRGVFTDPFAKVSEAAQPFKSYIIWTVLALTLGIFGADKFYIGETKHGFLKLASVFSPFILFGLFWAMWDGYHALFMTKETLVEGIALPPPLEAFGLSKTPGDIFLPGGTKPESKQGGFADAFAGFTSNTFNLLAAPPIMGAMGSIQQELQRLRGVAGAAEASEGMSNENLQRLREEQNAAALARTMNQATDSNENDELQQLRVKQASEKLERTIGYRQGGGGYVPENGPGAVIAGALGALVLAGGLKGVYDFLSRL
jgi:hypothetical protein